MIKIHGKGNSCKANRYMVKLVTNVCVYANLCVSALKGIISSSKICTPHDWLNKFYNFYIATVVSVVGLCIQFDVCHGNQPSKSKLALYKPSQSFKVL